MLECLDKAWAVIMVFLITFLELNWLVKKAFSCKLLYNVS